VVLAETLGSCGANHACPPGFYAVGLDINANHLKSARGGWVTGKTWPLHLGRSTSVWAIELRNDAGELTCVSRLTMSVLAQRG
jgi:1,4-dihydroxy-2-naphthoyl-CoA hydrolase